MDELKKLLLTAVGAAAISMEKAEDALKELMEKGSLTVKEGKELQEELRRRRKDAQASLVEKEDLLHMMNELSFADKREVDDLKERIASLEAKLKD